MLDAALSGFTVLDCSQGIAGPYCACLLADLGARVIKVEPPEGDWGRSIGVRQGNSSVIFKCFNRGKEGIVLDLKEVAARDALLRLVEHADVFLESNRPGVMRRLGLAYADLGKRNPKLVYLSVSGFGQSGPYMQQPATDAVLQAFTGLAYGASGSNAPIRVQVAVIDVSTGLYASHAVLAALMQRSRDGKGQYLDISLTHAAAALQNYKIAEDAALQGEKQSEGYAGIGIYCTADGYLAVSAMRDKHVTGLLELIGCAELLKEPRFTTPELRHENQDALREIISGKIRAMPTRYWVEAMNKANLLCQEVLTYGRFLADAQVQSEEIFHFIEEKDAGPMPIARLPGGARDGRRLGASPGLGQHTREVLRGAGFSEREVADLLHAGRN